MKIKDKKQEVVQKREHYIDNKKFLKEMSTYIKEVKLCKIEKRELPRVPEYIGECILAISEHLSYKSNFINYQFREDMVADGVENCLQYIQNFDPEKSNNPFAYFTQIIFFAFVRKIQKEKKQLYVKYRAIEDTINHEGHDAEGSPVDKYGDADSDKFMREFMDTFEKSKSNKKKKLKEVKRKGILKFVGPGIINAVGQAESEKLAAEIADELVEELVKNDEQI